MWELSSEEFALFANAETRSQVTGCECDIQLSIAEQMYLIGKALWLINPTAKLPTVVATEFTINVNKFDYFFGRVTSSTHNTLRSVQNATDLTTLGIKNEQQLLLVIHAAQKGSIVSTKTNTFGTTITRNVVIGNSGSLNVSFFYNGGNLNSIPSVTTIIPKIYK